MNLGPAEEKARQLAKQGLPVKQISVSTGLSLSKVSGCVQDILLLNDLPELHRRAAASGKTPLEYISEVARQARNLPSARRHPYGPLSQSIVDFMLADRMITVCPQEAPSDEEELSELREYHRRKAQESWDWRVVNQKSKKRHG